MESLMKGNLDVELKSLDAAAKTAKAKGDTKTYKELEARTEDMLADAAYAILRKQMKNFLK
jgi:hypothetical protein